jgi:hypothetical protein
LKIWTREGLGWESVGEEERMAGWELGLVDNGDGGGERVSVGPDLYNSSCAWAIPPEVDETIDAAGRWTARGW